MAVTEDVKLGHNVKIFHPDLINLYSCAIGDEAEIGDFVEKASLKKLSNEEVKTDNFTDGSVICAIGKRYLWLR